MDFRFLVPQYLFLMLQARKTESAPIVLTQLGQGLFSIGVASAEKVEM